VGEGGLDGGDEAGAARNSRAGGVVHGGDSGVRSQENRGQNTDPDCRFAVSVPLSPVPVPCPLSPLFLI